MVPEFNFLHSSIKMEAADKMFDGSPAKGYSFSFFTDSSTMAHLVHAAGHFKSVGEAKRNGWDKPIPLGTTFLTLGKRKISVVIVNIHPDDVRIS